MTAEGSVAANKADRKLASSNEEKGIKKVKLLE